VPARINAAIGAVGMSERFAWHERRGFRDEGGGEWGSDAQRRSPRLAEAGKGRRLPSGDRTREEVAADSAREGHVLFHGARRNVNAEKAPPPATLKVARRERARAPSIRDFRYRRMLPLSLALPIVSSAVVSYVRRCGESLALEVGLVGTSCRLFATSTTARAIRPGLVSIHPLRTLEG